LAFDHLSVKQLSQYLEINAGMHMGHRQVAASSIQ
jgi:hypothetical protein